MIIASAVFATAIIFLSDSDGKDRYVTYNRPLLLNPVNFPKKKSTS